MRRVCQSRLRALGGMRDLCESVVTKLIKAAGQCAPLGTEGALVLDIARYRSTPPAVFADLRSPWS